jgi:hypothetical protein
MRRAIYLLFAAGLIIAGCSSPPPSAEAKPVAVVKEEPVEPDEPCVASGKAPGAKEAAEKWCTGGVFTSVDVNSGNGSFVVLLQFSKKGFRSWSSNSQAILGRFRDLTDEMVRTTEMNVAFSLHDTAGQMVGGCARTRTAPISTCRAQ